MNRALDSFHSPHRPAFHFVHFVSSHPAIHSAVQKWPFADYNPLLLDVCLNAAILPCAVLCFDGIYETVYFVPLWCLTGYHCASM